MPAASAISRRVNPRERRRLTIAINIEIDLPHLLDPVPGPLRPQPHDVDPLQLDVFVPLQARRLARLNQSYLAIPGIDFYFLAPVGKSRSRLDLGHAVGQDLAHPIFLRTQAAGVDAILSRLAQRDNAHGENRQAEQHLVKRERAWPSFIAPHSLKLRRGP